MCGICGVFDAAQPATAWRDLLPRMNACQLHRGPDETGVHFSGPCGLGHSRLRIVDLSPLGGQPMANEDESIWITYNGEIYNFRELRRALGDRHRWRGHSDTEVLLHWYEERGIDGLSALNGMFALAIWDVRRSRLILARDRMGKKPLYYHVTGQRLLFASELKALLADDTVVRELDPRALCSYLTLGYVPAPATIFRDVLKLPPASYLVVERGADGRLSMQGPQSYWRLAYVPDGRLTEQTCLEHLRPLLQDAVQCRMYSDVPLGAFLSGGIDSSTIVAYMSQASTRPVQTFSVGFDDESFDELPWADQVARQFGTDHRTFRCTPDMLEVLPLLVHHYDEPFADASAVPTYYLAKLAKEYVTVALAGDGGDETFAGYTRYGKAFERARYAGVPRAMVRPLSRLLARMYPTTARGWGILYRHSQSAMDAFLSDLCFFLGPHLRDLMADRFAPAVERSIIDDVRRLSLEGGATDLLTRMQYVDQMLYLPDDILVKVDRASMAVSLEVRAPLLDYRVVEFMATVPSELRYRGSRTKHLLKEAMAGQLPDDVLNRRKMGFGVPIGSWFRGRAANFAADILLDRRVAERGFFRPGQVEQLLHLHRRGPRDMSIKIWALLFFELWCREWLDRASGA